MSLKYELILIMMKCEDLVNFFKKEDMATDETSSYLKEFKETSIQRDYLTDVFTHKVEFSEEDFEKNIDVMSEETKSYRERIKNKLQVFLSPVPEHPEWTYCFYLHYNSLYENIMDGLPSKIIHFYVSLFLKYVPEIFFISYHGGCNDGDISRYFCDSDKNINLEYIEHKENETEKFKKFAKRVQKERKIPVLDLHVFLDSNCDVKRWNYHFTFDISKMKKEDVKKWKTTPK